MTLGMMATDAERRIDFEAMRGFKLQRVQRQLEAKDLGAIICFDPDNIRYLTSTAIGEWSRDKYVVVRRPRGGEPVLFELGSAGQVKKELCPGSRRTSGSAVAGSAEPTTPPATPSRSRAPWRRSRRRSPARRWRISGSGSTPSTCTSWTASRTRA
jgi:Xaa-Pro dipeptidase